VVGGQKEERALEYETIGMKSRSTQVNLVGGRPGKKVSQGETQGERNGAKGQRDRLPAGGED